MNVDDMEAAQIAAKALALQEKMAAHVALVAFARDRVNASSIYDNGTGSLVELPEAGKCIITNAHVWDAYQDDKLRGGPCHLALTGSGIVQPLDISDADLIGFERDLDIAVLRYPAERIEAIGKRFYKIDPWPARRAERGNSLALVGYPGMRTGVVAEMYYHESVLVSATVMDVSDRQIRYSFARPVEIVVHSTRPITDFRWGGLSGSIVYAAEEASNRLLPCAIHHSGNDGTADALFYATHLDYVQADGTVRSQSAA